LPLDRWPDLCRPVNTGESISELEPGNCTDLSRARPGVAPDLFGSSNRAGVAFLDDEQLIVYAVEPTGLFSSRQSPEISSAFRLRVSLLDAKSGKQVMTKDWGTRPHDSAVQITSGGVLVKTGAIVKLYSTDFAQSRELPFALDPNGSYFTSVSASGKTIAISHYLKRGTIGSVILTYSMRIR